MSVDQVFLDWRSSCLDQAVRWFEREHGPSQQTWDLSPLWVVVPGRRAGRRLLELLAERAGAGDCVLVPPRIITLGRLPEQLYRSDPPVAGELHALLARVRAVRESPDATLRAIVPDPPSPHDLPRLIDIAEDLAELDEQIGAGALTFDQAVARLAESGICPDMKRWQALAELHRAYHGVLASMGSCDRNAARWSALTQGRCAGDHHIVLLATAQISEIVRRMILQLPTPVTALIHAPQSLAADFDPLGCISAQRWATRGIDLDDRRIHFVDRSSQQADQVVASIAHNTPAVAGDTVEHREDSETSGGSGGGGRVHVDQITVGLGDESDGPMVERALEIAGCPARLGQGTAVELTTPSTLLAALGRFANQQRFDDLAALLRHPDIEAYLIAQSNTDQGVDRADLARQSTAEWIGLLDRYATEHLQGQVTERWLGDDQVRARLKATHDQIVALLPDDCTTPQPLPRWSQPIASALESVYETLELDAAERYDAVATGALEVIGQTLREQAALDPADPSTVHLTFAQAVAFTLSRLTGHAIPPEAGAPAVEVLGWLELPLDDAPVLVVCGLNEGVVPASKTSDPFLPDSARRVLGLVDNQQRYARDAYLLSAIVAARPQATLIAARTGRDDQPLAPSRLLLACDAPTIATRLRRFYDDTSPATRSQPVLFQPGPDNRFAIPPPTGSDPVRRLSVTAVGDYLACPYRFYLKHVLRLEAVNDHAVEMDPLRFGNLAHDVLRWFGQSEHAHSTDAPSIGRSLIDHMRALVDERFGPHPPAAVAIQCEQLRARLAGFAIWQAQQAADGWRIVPEHIEAKFERDLQLGGEPFILSGRIDRIDHHPDRGYRILDYKTGDTVADPDKTHRTGPAKNKQWVNFQLPLYRWLTADALGDANVALGYIRLPKDNLKAGLAEAPWSNNELDDALDRARQIIDLIRQGVFWPPAPPPNYEDGFEAICMDTFIDRERVIAQAVST